MKLAKAWIAATVLALAASQGGCDNLVASYQPLFQSADAISDGALRPGWWVTQDANCKIDPKRSNRDWPECSGPMLIPERSSGMVSILEEGQEAVRLEWRLVDGDPLLLEWGFRPRAVAPDQSQTVYFYSGVEPLRRDRKGRVIALRHWPLVCGPVEPPAASEPRRRRGTKSPWPGVEMESGGCRPKDLAGLRDAARRSGGIPGEVQSLRWLRERRADDQTLEEWISSR